MDRRQGRGKVHMIQYYWRWAKSSMMLTWVLGVWGASISMESVGETHRFSCHKFKYFKYGERGHVNRDCKKAHMCFYCHQLVHFKPDCPKWVAKGVMVLTHSLVGGQGRVSKKHWYVFLSLTISFCVYLK